MIHAMSMYANKRELEEGVMKDTTLSDIEKLRYIFNARKDDIRSFDIHLYYAILGTLDSIKIGAKKEE